MSQGINPVADRKQRKQTLIQANLARDKGSFLRPSQQSGRPQPKACVRQRSSSASGNYGTTCSLVQGTPDQRHQPSRDHGATQGRGEARPEVARNLRNYLWSIFEYAIDSGLITANPVPTVRVLKKRDQTKHPALSPDQIGEFLRKLDDRTLMNERTRIAMLLVMLTTCRKAEIIGGKWEEIDLDAGVWEIPDGRMKNKLPHWVPLSRQATSLLRELRNMTPANQELLFPEPPRPAALDGQP